MIKYSFFLILGLGLLFKDFLLGPYFPVFLNDDSNQWGAQYLLAFLILITMGEMVRKFYWYAKRHARQNTDKSKGLSETTNS